MNVADLKWRPESYSDFPDPVALVLNGIQGQMRREMVHDMLTAEGEHREFYDDVLGSIEPGILKEQADEQVIQNLSNFHSPVWMGGEYLPGVVPGEVEIARIVLHSTHGDIISVRARWKLGCYHYRVVDEYEELGTKYALSRETSIRPLTLGQLIDLLQTSKAVNSCVGIEGDGLVESWWDAHYGEGVPPEDCLYAFVESDLYSELSAWYEKRANEWISERREEERLQRCEDCGKMCDSTADHDCPEKGARLAREEERRRQREAKIDELVAPFASEIQRVIEDWKTANPFGPGMGGAMGAAAHRVRISTLEGFLRDTVVREGAMPSGLHKLEYQFCGSQTFSVDFDRLPKEAQWAQVGDPRFGELGWQEWLDDLFGKERSR